MVADRAPSAGEGVEAGAVVGVMVSMIPRPSPSGAGVPIGAGVSASAATGVGVATRASMPTVAASVVHEDQLYCDGGQGKFDGKDGVSTGLYARRRFIDVGNQSVER